LADASCWEKTPKSDPDEIKDIPVEMTIVGEKYGIEHRT